MIDICLKGGLGNQMFQYALYKQYEKMNIPAMCFFGEELSDKKQPTMLKEVFPKIQLITDEDKHEYNRIIKKKMRRALGKCIQNIHPIYYEKNDGVFDSNIFRFRDKVLVGYWQTSKYWQEIKKEIVQLFDFRDDYYRDLLPVLNMIDCCESVSVHIRGGDYLKKENRELFGDICTAKYYENAFLRVHQICNDPVFFVFSNDNIMNIIPNKKNVIRVDSILNKKLPDWIDMMLMSRCKNNIIANSSFSWWAAFLNRNNNKLVIAPNRWINGKQTSDIWEKEWIQVDGNNEI